MVLFGCARPPPQHTKTLWLTSLEVSGLQPRDSGPTSSLEVPGSLPRKSPARNFWRGYALFVPRSLQISRARLSESPQLEFFWHAYTF